MKIQNSENWKKKTTLQWYKKYSAHLYDKSIMPQCTWKTGIVKKYFAQYS